MLEKVVDAGGSSGEFSAEWIPPSIAREAGYAIVPDVLSDGECSSLVNEFSKSEIPRSRAGARHLMASETCRELAYDPRLLALAEEWLGGPGVPFRATLFDKSPSSNWLVPWHQDTALPLASRFDAPGWGPWSEKAGVLYAHAPGYALEQVVALRVDLDGSSDDNGCLRVMPGSHRQGVLTDDQVAHYAATNEQVECLVPRGGVLAMRPLLIHSSAKAQSDKPGRVLHIEYARSLDLAQGIRLAIA